jgi:predicted dehydrogenase
LKILIIGLGSIAKKHIGAIQYLFPGSKIYALRTNSMDTIENVENIYSLDSIDCKLDFAIISNPTKLHGDTILKLLKFNCSLFIEKPVLNDLEFARIITTELSKCGVKTYVAFNLRFHPALIFLKKFLAKNVLNINEVNVYCGSYLPDWRPNVPFHETYSANPKLGGGVHLDLIHEIDYSTWLFGIPDKTDLTLRSNSTLNIDSIDCAHYNCYYDNFLLNIKLNYFRRDAKREIEIVSETETIKCDLLKSEIIDLTNNNILFKTEYNIMVTYLSQMQYFVETVRAGIQPMNSFDESLQVLKIALNANVKE